MKLWTGVSCLLAVVLLLAPLVPAESPAGSTALQVGSHTIHHWFSSTSDTNKTLLGPQAAGQRYAFMFSLDDVPNATADVQVTLNATSAHANVSDANRTTIIGRNVTTASGFAFFVPNATENGTIVIDFRITIANASASPPELEGEANFTLSFDYLGVAVIAPTVPPVFPTSYYWIGGGVLLLAIALGAYTARARAVKKRMRGPTRSSTMQELELEDRAEKKPEQAAQIKQEIRAQETVREKRRELQILEAKRADVHKNMDLLKKRHEMGGLSKLQYDNMIAKRKIELAKIEADIAEMEGADGGSAAA